MIIRINVADTTAQCQLAIKFGVEPGETAIELLRVAKKLNINVVGVRCHIS